MLTPLMIQALENPSISLLATSQDECPQFPLTLKSMANYNINSLSCHWNAKFLAATIASDKNGGEGKWNSKMFDIFFTLSKVWGSEQSISILIPEKETLVHFQKYIFSSVLLLEGSVTVSRWNSVYLIVTWASPSIRVGFTLVWLGLRPRHTSPSIRVTHLGAIKNKTVSYANLFDTKRRCSLFLSGDNEFEGDNDKQHVFFHGPE